MKALKSFNSTDPVSSKSQGPLGKMKKFSKMEAAVSVRVQLDDFTIKLTPCS